MLRAKDSLEVHSCFRVLSIFFIGEAVDKVISYRTNPPES